MCRYHNHPVSCRSTTSHTLSVSLSLEIRLEFLQGSNRSARFWTLTTAFKSNFCFKSSKFQSFDHFCWFRFSSICVSMQICCSFWELQLGSRIWFVIDWICDLRSHSIRISAFFVAWFWLNCAFLAIVRSAVYLAYPPYFLLAVNRPATPPTALLAPFRSIGRLPLLKPKQTHSAHPSCNPTFTPTG